MLQQAFEEMNRNLDGWNWYWLSYGEKCYAFAVVTAYPLDDDGPSAPAGCRLEPHPDKQKVWVGPAGEEMEVDQWLMEVEEQSGDNICEFVALAYAHCCKEFGSPLPEL